MKKLKYIAIAFVGCLMSTACMDGGIDGEWDEPSGQPTIGNNDITEENLVSIAQLKSTYATAIANTPVKVTDDIKIKGIVTANDIAGNVYSYVTIDDGTGAIFVNIAEGGLFSYLPVGQEILISLKDLYVGGYGSQPGIGTPYTNKNGRTYISRMGPAVWRQHFKLIGKADASKIVPVEFDKSKYKDAAYMTENCGKLMTIKGVTFKKGDGKTLWAPDSEKDAGNGVNRGLTGLSESNLVVRSSSYADFAADPLPQGTVNITGVFGRYNSTWQITVRSMDDVQPAE
jgi:hypothetical protein